MSFLSEQYFGALKWLSDRMSQRKEGLCLGCRDKPVQVAWLCRFLGTSLRSAADYAAELPQNFAVASAYSQRVFGALCSGPKLFLNDLC